MVIAQSKITAQGQISVPAEIRRKLGLGPGAVLEWTELGDDVVVRRAGRFSSEDVHRAIFSEKPETVSLIDIKEGIKQRMRGKYAKR
ncbi:MAG: AbrB/MazE/SpoVT family DNA-binding domain-containing protein [Pyrinomonadaceae bacterium]